MKPNTLILGKTNVTNEHVEKSFIAKFSKLREHKGELLIEENGVSVQSTRLSLVHNIVWEVG